MNLFSYHPNWIRIYIFLFHILKFALFYRSRDVIWSLLVSRTTEIFTMYVELFDSWSIVERSHSKYRNEFPKQRTVTMIFFYQKDFTVCHYQYSVSSIVRCDVLQCSATIVYRARANCHRLKLVKSAFVYMSGGYPTIFLYRSHFSINLLTFCYQVRRLHIFFCWSTIWTLLKVRDKATSCTFKISAETPYFSHGFN